jgi:hypothetical protein
VKNFAQGTIYSMPTDQVAGLVNPTEFSRLLQEGQRLEELRHCGLTEDEIALKLQHDTSSSKRVRFLRLSKGFVLPLYAAVNRLNLIELITIGSSRVDSQTDVELFVFPSNRLVDSTHFSSTVPVNSAG